MNTNLCIIFFDNKSIRATELDWLMEIPTLDEDITTHLLELFLSDQEVLDYAAHPVNLVFNIRAQGLKVFTHQRAQSVSLHLSHPFLCSLN